MNARLWSRGLDLLGQLAESDGPVPAASLGASLNLTARMVRSSLASTEEWLRARHITLRHGPGRGFWLEGSPQSRTELAADIRQVKRPVPWLTPEARRQLVLLTLFFTERPPQIKQLQQVLNLSRTPTIKVLDAAAQWLRGNNLRLIRRQHVGCLIAGEEADWRDAAVNLLRECCGDARLLAILKGASPAAGASGRGRAWLEPALTRIWKRLDVALVRSAILPTRRDSTRLMSDRAHIELFLHLAVMVQRVRAGRMIAAGQDRSDGSATAGIPDAVEQIAARVQTLLGVQLPAAERVWLARWLPVHGRGAGAEHARGIAGDADLDTGDLVTRMVMQASLALHPALRTDDDLFDHLADHVQAMFERRPEALLAGDPLLRDVQKQYPSVYASARKSSLVLSNRLGRELNEAEVGGIAVCYIAAMERLLHVDRPTRKVLVVCSEGAVTAWLLVSRLRAEFPEVEVVGVVSALEFESEPRPRGVDFIVSTIPLRVKGMHAMQVTPLLGPEDCFRLREAFGRSAGIAAAAGTQALPSAHLSDLLTAQTIELGVEARTWQEVVDKAGRCLLRTGAIDERFIGAMKDVMVEYGPYMVIWPEVALLHARPLGVGRLSMGLITLHDPVPFGHPENDPVRIAVVLGAMDNRSHVTALQDLNRMMQHEEARSAIGRTQHKSVVLNWVRRYSNNTEM